MQEPETHPFEPGHYVRLKSGGPEMTVQAVSGEDVTVTFVNEARMPQLERFPAACLRFSEEQEEEAEVSNVVPLRPLRWWSVFSACYFWVEKPDGTSLSVYRVSFDPAHPDQLLLARPHRPAWRNLREQIGDAGVLHVWLGNRKKEKKRRFVVSYTGSTWLPLCLDVTDEGSALEHVLLTGVRYDEGAESG